MVRNLKELHPGKWSVSYVDDEDAVRVECDGMDNAFTAAARLQAFCDIYNVRRVEVHHAGRTYRYAGWQPGMRYEYVNKFGTTIWCGDFPKWDH